MSVLQEFMAKSDPRYGSWMCSICHKRPCDCNGMLPPVDMITQYFSTKSQAEKKKGAAATARDDTLAHREPESGGISG